MISYAFSIDIKDQDPTLNDYLLLTINNFIKKKILFILYPLLQYQGQCKNKNMSRNRKIKIKSKSKTNKITLDGCTKK